MDDLLIKYVTGEATPQEVAEVERWLQADAANRKKFDEYRILWALGRRTASAGTPGSAEAQKAWRQLSGKLGQTPAAGGSGPVKRSVAHRRLRLAAVMTGLLILSAAGYILLAPNRPGGSAGPTAGAARRGADSPDGEITPTLQSPAMPSPTVRMPLVHWKAIAGRRPVTDTLPDGTVVTLNR